MSTTTDDEILEAAVEEALRRRDNIIPAHVRAEMKRTLKILLGVHTDAREILAALRERPPVLASGEEPKPGVEAPAEQPDAKGAKR